MIAVKCVPNDSLTLVLPTPMLCESPFTTRRVAVRDVSRSATA